MTDLSPAARAMAQAFDDAAALRALADHQIPAQIIAEELERLS